MYLTAISVDISKLTTPTVDASSVVNADEKNLWLL